MEKYFVEDIEQVQNENEDVIHIYEPLEFDIDENYQYINNDKLFLFISNLIYYGVAFPVLTVLNKIIYDLKIEGKEYIKNLKTGAISVSNHVLILDCTMVGLSFGIKKLYFTTREGSFKIPFVRKLIKLLRAVPIPTDIKNKKFFTKELDNAIQEGKIIHFYPEKALWPYYDKIRNFQNGAFAFAIRNNVPVIPMVITFREPKGIRKLFKRKKDVTLKILEPIKYKSKNSENEAENCIDSENTKNDVTKNYVHIENENQEDNESSKNEIEKFKNQVHRVMQAYAEQAYNINVQNNNEQNNKI